MCLLNNFDDNQRNYGKLHNEQVYRWEQEMGDGHIFSPFSEPNCFKNEMRGDKN